MPASAFAADISLSWARPNDARVAGYNIYYGISGDQYRTEPKIRVESGDQTNVLIQDMLEWQTYDFSMTSMDAEGNESEFSEEITYTVSSEPEESARSISSDSDKESEKDDENTAEVNCFIRTMFPPHLL